MKFAEMTLEQVQQAIKAGSPDDIRAFLAQEGIEIPAKAPWNLPAEIDKFGRKLWQTLMITPVETCAADEHDFQLAGNCEMERNAATMPFAASSENPADRSSSAAVFSAFSRLIEAAVTKKQK